MKICIIGSAGHTNYVLDGVRRDKDSKIVGIAAGIQGEGIDKLTEQIGELEEKPAVFDDYREMLEQLQPDVVAVASHFYQQASITLEVLKRGINVFVEKPVATNLSELASVKRFYQQSNLHLAAMFGIRYKPCFMTAWKLVQQGAVGKVRLMNAQKSYKLGSRPEFYKKRETYGGTIPWVGSHAVDWLHWFSGERFETVYAAHSNQYNQGHGELEISALLHFRLTNGAMGSVNIDYLRPDTAGSHGDDRIRVAGTEGVIEVCDERVFLINSKKKGVQEVSLENSEGIFLDFLSQVRGKGKCLVSAEDSFYITEVCLKARVAADENRIVML
ncbi:gfo/Idh/MocA family oxidoreductase [Iocasia frigidifontis]|uniref:Gfo/Idh/MocA family oxidoreductase n=1 Tax=Iocasia fonsfrigidae TaxID=2682810 RepID=A0A8A7K6J2_9FIRM|nr:Gfo/Idh/MocA family oxidoreductase [Iocasia fonsfrigidae]QTL97336.1 gfo/Idh/MocA family oxidoreductase [Iocasia fonsfrigidae]